MYWVGIAKSQLGDDIEAVIWFRRSIEANAIFPSRILPSPPRWR
jgi:hypothetical protein